MICLSEWALILITDAPRNTDSRPYGVACNPKVYPLFQVLLTSSEVFQMLTENKKIRIPTCPKCAVLWDQAMEKLDEKVIDRLSDAGMRMRSGE